MKNFIRTLFVAVALLGATQASAQATRTWVSGVGDDVNPCSRTAPCKTFAGAIPKTATGGEINVVDPGDYGRVSITKSITIDGAGTLATIQPPDGQNGILVSAPAGSVVILRNLSINGAGATRGLNGIRVVAVGEIHVENVAISGFSAQGIDFAPTNDAPSSLFVDKANIRNNTGGAIHIHPTSPATTSATINRAVLSGNGRGLRNEGGTVVSVRDSVASGNVANGFVSLATDGRAAVLSLLNTTSVNNIATGVYAGAMANIKMTGVTVSRNGSGLIAVDGGNLYSFGNNYVTANTGFNGPASGTLPPL